MIHLVNLPGIAKIEATCDVNRRTGAKVDPELEQMLEAVVREVFGLGFVPKFEDDYGDVWVLPDASYYTAQEVSAQISLFRGWGWDVTNGAGALLACLPLLAPVLAVVDGGSEGNSKLAIEAKAWAEKRQGSVSPKDRKLNATFLSLGTQKRSPS